MKVKITNISEGLSEHDFISNSQELGIEDESEFQNPINIHLRIQKFESNYFFEINVKTLAHFECDRCLDEFNREIRAFRKLTFTSKQLLVDETSDDVCLLLPNQVFIDFGPHIREMLLLAFPVKNLCAEDCKGLCSMCGANLNCETCGCEKTTYDPRWDVLKESKEN